MPQRIKKPVPNTFASVTLFRDDLESIVQAIQESTGEAPTIRDNEYKYESLDELKANRGESTKHLCISSTRVASHVRFEVRHDDDVSLYMSEHDCSEKAREAYSAVSQILRDRRRWFCFLSELPEMPIWMALVLVLAVGLGFSFPTPLNIGMFIVALMGLAYHLLVLVGSLAGNGCHSRIYLCNRHELRDCSNKIGFW